MVGTIAMPDRGGICRPDGRAVTAVPVHSTLFEYARLWSLRRSFRYRVRRSNLGRE